MVVAPSMCRVRRGAAVVKIAKKAPLQIRKRGALRGGWQLRNTATMFGEPLRTGVTGVENVTHLPDERVYAHDVPE